MDGTDWYRDHLGFDPRGTFTRPDGSDVWVYERAKGISTQLVDGNTVLKWTFSTGFTNIYNMHGPHIVSPETEEFMGDPAGYYSIYTRFKFNIPGVKMRVGYESVHTDVITTTGDWQEYLWCGKADGPDANRFNDFIYYIDESVGTKECQLEISNIDFDVADSEIIENHDWKEVSANERICTKCGYKVSESNITVIENNGLTETEYRKKYNPSAGIPYSDTSITVPVNGNDNGNFTYEWKSKTDGGLWKSLSLNRVTTDKNTLKIKNATRGLNQTKTMLTVRNASNEPIQSDEVTLTVYSLPNVDGKMTLTEKLGWNPISEEWNKHPGEGAWIMNHSDLSTLKKTFADGYLRFQWNYDGVGKGTGGVRFTGVKFHPPKNENFYGQPGKHYRLYTKFRSLPVDDGLHIAYETMAGTKVFKTTGDWQEVTLDLNGVGIDKSLWHGFTWYFYPKSGNETYQRTLDIAEMEIYEID